MSQSDTQDEIVFELLLMHKSLYSEHVMMICDDMCDDMSCCCSLSMGLPLLCRMTDDSCTFQRQCRYTLVYLRSVINVYT
jgi:hypothetical protein